MVEEVDGVHEVVDEVVEGTYEVVVVEGALPDQLVLPEVVLLVVEGV